jgi:hypothetical protein
VRPQTLMYLQEYQNTYPSKALVELVALITKKPV